MPGKLKVKIVAGRHLPVMDRASDLTDAFVEVGARSCPSNRRERQALWRILATSPAVPPPVPGPPACRVRCLASPPWRADCWDCGPCNGCTARRRQRHAQPRGKAVYCSVCRGDPDVRTPNRPPASQEIPRRGQAATETHTHPPTSTLLCGEGTWFFNARVMEMLFQNVDTVCYGHGRAARRSPL